jgi:hypothetical protein
MFCTIQFWFMKHIPDESLLNVQIRFFFFVEVISNHPASFFFFFLDLAQIIHIYLLILQELAACIPERSVPFSF